MTIRTAVIGAGAMGRHHVRLYHDLTESELVAVADSDSTIAEAMARRHNIRSYTDVRALLDAEEIEAVSICVPTTLHLDVTREAIQRGLHVLIE